MLGTEKIEKAAEALAHIVIAGKKMKENGKLGAEDIPTAIELATKAPEIFEAFSDPQGLVAELKDVDVKDFIAIVMKLDELVKKVEAV